MRDDTLITCTMTIKRGTVMMQDEVLGLLHDDGKGRMLSATGACVGAIDYANGLVELGTVPMFDNPKLGRKNRPRTKP